MSQDSFEAITYHGGTNIAEARNGAAEKATGDWLCFLDGDDELGHGYLTEMERVHRRHYAPKRLFTPAVSYVRNRRRRPARFWPTIPFEKGNWLIIGTLIEREFFNEIGGFRDWPHGLEDWDLWARASLAGASVVKVPRAVYVAHWNEESAHHVLARDRRAWNRWHQKVGHSLWPELYDAVE